MVQPKLRFPEFVDEWKRTSLSEVIREKPRNGYSPEPVDYETDKKVFSISAVTTGTFREECYKYADFETDPNAHYWVKNEDILIQRSNTSEYVGVSAMYEGEDDQYIYSDLLIKVHAKKTINSRFLSNYLISPVIRTYYRRNACGTSGNMPKINQKVVSDTPIAIPSKKEQDKIGALLTEINNKIQKQEAIINDYEENKRGILQKIFDQELRFKDNNGEQFSDWEVMPLNSLLVERKQKAKKDGNYEHVSLTKEGVVPKSARYERDFLVKSEDKDYKITKINDICYNPANLKFGVICRNKYGEGIFSPIYITFEVSDKAIPEFMDILLTRWDFINYALRYQEGTVYERMAVSPENLLKIKVAIPELDEQIKISKFIETLDNKILAEKKLLEDWKELKKALLQQMFV